MFPVCWDQMSEWNGSSRNRLLCEDELHILLKAAPKHVKRSFWNTSHSGCQGQDAKEDRCKTFRVFTLFLPAIVVKELQSTNKPKTPHNTQYHSLPLEQEISSLACVWMSDPSESALSPPRSNSAPRKWSNLYNAQQHSSNAPNPNPNPNPTIVLKLKN
jgi:hypothetical protein